MLFKPRGVTGGGGKSPGNLGALHSRRLTTDKDAKERKREEDTRTRKETVRVREPETRNLAPRDLGPGTRLTKSETLDPRPVSGSRTLQVSGGSY